MTGYDVSSRVEVVGKTGITHEINLVTTRWTETIAIECKYCGEEMTAGFKELVAFHGKLQDLHGIKTAMYDKLYAN